MASRLDTGIINVSFLTVFIVMWLSNRYCILMYLSIKSVMFANYTQIFQQKKTSRVIFLSMFISLQLYPRRGGKEEREKNREREW